MSHQPAAADTPPTATPATPEMTMSTAATAAIVHAVPVIIGLPPIMKSIQSRPIVGLRCHSTDVDGKMAWSM
jgi:hypothetical protein